MHRNLTPAMRIKFLGRMLGATLMIAAASTAAAHTNLRPFALDAQGNLLRIYNLYGVVASGGAYGTHHWKRAQLGLDYAGNYQKHVNSDISNGSDQHLTLGLTLQPSRRWSTDLRESAGTVSTATSELFNTPSNDSSSVITASGLLFDSQTTFAQSSASVTYFESARTSFTFGRSAFLQELKAFGLSNSRGYTVREAGSAA